MYKLNIKKIISEMKCKLEGTEKQIYTTGNVLREKIHTKEKHLKNQKQIKNKTNK